MTDEFGEIDDDLVEVTPTWWSVGVFMVDRAYGGSEEGGWYYDYGIPVHDPDKVIYTRCFNNEAQAQEYRRTLQTICDSWNRGRRSISSVLSDGEYRAVITDNDFPRVWPAKKPRYE